MTHTTKHTPQWNVQPHSNVSRSIFDAEGKVIAVCSTEQALLIAAAPAMYEALQALVEVFPSVVKMTPYGVPMSISKIHDNAVAALAQMEGR